MTELPEKSGGVIGSFGGFVLTFKPQGGVFRTPSRTNPHHVPGGVGWGFALIGALLGKGQEEDKADERLPCDRIGKLSGRVYVARAIWKNQNICISQPLSGHRHPVSSVIIQST